MSDSVPRRAVLKGASLGIVAGVAAAGLGRIPELANGRAPSTAPDPADLSPLGENVVAHIRNASTGEIAILAGGREIVTSDPALVGRLLRLARSSGKET